jgi:glycosyltransferase involved in cell wall biosynthesis
MRGSVALVHSARWEGFGLVLLEAMREGLPIVATRVGAIPEVVDDGTTGFLVASEDPDALANAVLSLLRDPELAVQSGRAGFERLERHFSADRMGARTAELYDEVVEPDLSPT